MDISKAIWLEVAESADMADSGDPFDTKEQMDLRKEFKRRYIFNTTGKPTKEQLNAESMLMQLLILEQQQAFKVGFRTAIDFIMFDKERM